jgi:aminoglycoside 6'-N-acetyltransferase I
MIRRIKQADVSAIEEILKKIPTFTPDEVDVAMELVNIAANNPLQEDYHIFVYEQDDRILGYHCSGKRPLTNGVYDLYWIASDPESGVKGIGKSLLEHAEAFVVENKGRLFLAETSSKESYLRTRNFYLRNNFSIVAQIENFYSEGDHLIVFGKYYSKQ